MNSLRVKVVSNQHELYQSFRLRHTVFAEQLQWIPLQSDKLDIDRYDEWSDTICAYLDNKLAGSVRMTQAPHPFMIENEFKPCVEGLHTVKKTPDTAEITRLAIDPAYRTSLVTMKTIFSGMHEWCIDRNVRYTYMVSDYRLLKVVQRLGWPFVQVGATLPLPPAEAVSVCALLDLHDLPSL